MQSPRYRHESTLAAWKAEGYLFDINDNLFIGRKTRRFVQSKGFLNTYDGMCVCYLPAPESLRQSRWGIVYDDVSILGCGCETLELDEIYQAVEDYRIGATSGIVRDGDESSSKRKLPKYRDATTITTEKFDKDTNDVLIKSYRDKLAKAEEKQSSLVEQHKERVKSVDKICQEKLLEMEKRLDREMKKAKEEIDNQKKILLKEKLQHIQEAVQKERKKLRNQKATLIVEASSESSLSTMILDEKRKIWNEMLNSLVIGKMKSRHEVTIVRDDAYPVQTTIDIFNSRKSAAQLRWVIDCCFS